MLKRLLFPFITLFVPAIAQAALVVAASTNPTTGPAPVKNLDVSVSWTGADATKSTLVEIDCISTGTYTASTTVMAGETSAVIRNACIYTNRAMTGGTYSAATGVTTFTITARVTNNGTNQTGTTTFKLSAPKWRLFGSEEPATVVTAGPGLGQQHRAYCLWGTTEVPSDGGSYNPCGPLLLENCPHINFDFVTNTSIARPPVAVAAGTSKIWMTMCETPSFVAVTDGTGPCSHILINRGGAGLDNNPMSGLNSAMGEFIFDVPATRPFLNIESPNKPATGELPEALVSCGTY